MDNLPFSMRYYDPIVAIIQENINDHTRERFNLKNLTAFGAHRSNDTMRGVYETLGIVASANQKE